jgi:hypothetical protein
VGCCDAEKRDRYGEGTLHALSCSKCHRKLRRRPRYKTTPNLQEMKVTLGKVQQGTARRLLSAGLTFT